MEELYTGADRGQFRAIRLPTSTGVLLDTICRIRSATVYNYLTDNNYAIIAYEIEMFRDGRVELFKPQDRPNFTTLTMRTKSSSTSKMLYLEDAIINDFLNEKIPTDPMTWKSLEQEQSIQVLLGNIWTPFDYDEDNDIQYSQALHVSTFGTTTNTPLTIEEDWLTFKHRMGTDTTEHTVTTRDIPFVSRRDCLQEMYALADLQYA